MGEARRVGVGRHLGDHQQLAAAQGLAHPVAVRQGDGRVGAEHPERADLPPVHRLEQLDGLVPRPAHHGRASPEALYPIALGLAKAHVGGELGREPSHLTPSHGVGLPRHGEGSRPRLADATAHQVGVDDGVGLVHPLVGLVDPLAEQGDGLGGTGKELVETEQIAAGEAAATGHLVQLPGRIVQRRRQRLEAAHVLRHIGLVPAIDIEQVAAQAVPERHVAAGFECQVQIPLLRRHGTAGIQHHQPELGAPRPGLLQAAKQHGMGPGGVGTGEHHQIGELEILVTGGHQILPEGALVGHHRRRHAEPGVGVHVGAAQIPLHQLVGDVVILGGELARQIDADGIRPGLGQDGGKTRSQGVQGLLPADALPHPARIEQAIGKGQALQQAGPLDAQGTAVGRMLLIPLQLPVVSLPAQPDAAPHSAIGTGGLHSLAPCHVSDEGPIKKASAPLRGRTPLSGCLIVLYGEVTANPAPGCKGRRHCASGCRAAPPRCSRPLVGPALRESAPHAGKGAHRGYNAPPHRRER